MTNKAAVTPAYIREFRAEHAKLRCREVEGELNVRECRRNAAAVEVDDHVEHGNGREDDHDPSARRRRR